MIRRLLFLLAPAFLLGTTVYAQDTGDQSATVTPAPTLSLLTRTAEPEHTALLRRHLERTITPSTTQDTSTIRGRVIEAGTGNPISQVFITVAGSSVSTTTGENGAFILNRVPRGEQTITFRRIGYQAVTLRLDPAAARDTVVEVSMSVAPISLSEVVTTVSGSQMRYQVGNSIPVINAAAEVEQHSFRNLSDLLAARSIGVMVTEGTGSVNSPSRLRIRGINSINLSNDPIVIIDGVRALSGYERCIDGNLRGCDNLPSRLDEIDINDIETIEILKGPSAAAMWGSDASNGVIVINTKRGHVGRTRWTLRYEEGFSFAPTDLFVPTQGLGKPANGTAIQPCNLINQAAGVCIPIDSVAGGFNRFAHPRTTSMGTGRTTDLGMSVSGGSENMQFYFSGGYRSDLGTPKMPAVDQRLVREALGRPLDEWMVRPDARTTASFSGQITGRFSDRTDYQITTSFYQGESRTGGDGVMGAAGDLRTAADTFELSRGWDQFYVERKHQSNRFTGAIRLNWRPVDWFVGRAAFGRDYSFSDRGEFRRRGMCLPFCATTSTDALGRVAYGEGRQMNQSIDLGGTITIPVWDNRLVLRTSVGAQHIRNSRKSFSATAHDLPPGRIDIVAAPSGNRTVSHSSDDRATFGTYISQSFGLQDRFFVSMDVRRDIGSALGEEVAPFYPSLHFSWIASEDPRLGLAERGISLRLRAAYGHAGVQPSTSAKYRSFSQSNRFIEPGGIIDANYAVLSGPGNAELSPERSVEKEGGFELGLWNDRVMLDFTYFHKFTRDAIISRQLAPSLGLNSTVRQSYNVGNVKNTGFEAMVNTRLIQLPDFELGLNFSVSSRKNELVALAPGVEPFSITASNIDLATAVQNDAVVMPGYPLFGRWARPILGYSDVNGDGIITPDEIKISNTLEYIGPSQPKADVFVAPSVSLWRNRVHVAAGFSYVHQFTQVNSYAANSRFSNIDAYDMNTPLRAQACINASNNHYCWYETVNVLRLRNLSIRVQAPQNVARFLRADMASFQILGSNLGVWSAYSGFDPMANTAAASGNRVLGEAAAPRGMTWSFRTQLTF